MRLDRSTPIVRKLKSASKESPRWSRRSRSPAACSTIVPTDTEARLALARYEGWLGGFYAQQDDRELADQHFAASLAELETAASHSDVTIDQLFALGDAQFGIANQMVALEQFDQAYPILQQAEAKFDQLVAKSPRLANAQLRLGQIYIAQGQCHYAAGLLVESIQAYDRDRAQGKGAERNARLRGHGWQRFR